MRWNYMSKALSLVQVTVEHQDCPFFTVFLTIKTSSQNIPITLLQISLKLHQHRGSYCSKKLQKTILEEQFPVPRNTAASKISNGVISLLWQLLCHCNPDHNKVSSLFDTTVVLISPNRCLWRHSLRLNLGGIDPEKLYRATLIWSIGHINWRGKNQFIVDLPRCNMNSKVQISGKVMFDSKIYKSRDYQSVMVQMASMFSGSL